MITASFLQAILETITEKIALCAQLVERRHCSWDCCHYTDSYILLLPGESESAQDLGFSLSEYDVLDANYFGGKKVVPRSRGCCVDPALGPSAYKSLDCRLFPFWFEVDAGTLVLIRGLSCPIVRRGLEIDGHLHEVRRVAELLVRDPDIVRFLDSARMVNYERMPDVPPFSIPARLGY